MKASPSKAMQYPHCPPRKGHAGNMKRRPEKSSGAQRKGMEREDEEQKIEKLKNRKIEKFKKFKNQKIQNFRTRGLTPRYEDKKNENLNHAIFQWSLKS